MARIERGPQVEAAARRSRPGPAPRIAPPPRWIEPQLCKLAEKAPTGDRWVHEVKFDGYRIAARIDHNKVQLLTRSGLDWTSKYLGTAAALEKLPVTTAYIDGELCGVRADGVTSFELMQQASDKRSGALVYFAFDLLELDGADIARMNLLERKARLEDPDRALAAGNMQIYGHSDGGMAFVFTVTNVGNTDIPGYLVAIAAVSN